MTYGGGGGGAGGSGGGGGYGGAGGGTGYGGGDEQELPSYNQAPAGSIRFNTDSAKLEVYIGGPVGYGTTATGQWMQVDGWSPDTQTGGTRIVFGGGYTPTNVDTLDFVNAATTGNAVAFGELITTRQGLAAVGSRTRGVYAGGENPPARNEMEFITIASTGTCTDFGNLTRSVFGLTGGSNSERAIFAGGNNPNTDVMEYITMASQGAAQDFGDLFDAMRRGSCGNSSTRWILYGGSGAPSTIQFCSFSTLGNSADFGDCFTGGYTRAQGSICSSTRALFAGNDDPHANTIEYITMSTLGNGTDFGDLPYSSSLEQCGARGGGSSSTRGVTAGGGNPSTKFGSIDFGQIDSLGNFIDFGDLTEDRGQLAGASNGHGGLAN